MVSNISSTTPTSHADGTLSAIVQELRPLDTAGWLLRLWLPLDYDAGGGFGRYFLVRCVEDTLEARANDWSIYTRRALFCAAMPMAVANHTGSCWELAIPAHHDPGYQWLARRPLGSSLNLIGPLGQPYELASHTRALLVITTPATLPLVLPVIHQMLDRGGRVTLLVIGDADAATALMPLIPIPVEVRFIPADQWPAQLTDPLRWADQLCAALPNGDYASLAYQIRTARFRLDDAFAHALVTSDLICGTGACLACVVATRAGSYTRTCIHGPVLPLTTLA